MITPLSFAPDPLHSVRLAVLSATDSGLTVAMARSRVADDCLTESNGKWNRRGLLAKARPWLLWRDASQKSVALNRTSDKLNRRTPLNATGNGDVATLPYRHCRPLATVQLQRGVWVGFK